MGDQLNRNRRETSAPRCSIAAMRSSKIAVTKLSKIRAERSLHDALRGAARLCERSLFASATAWAIRDDGFAAGEHRDQRRDLARAAGRRLHRVGPKSQREEIRFVER